MIYNPIDFFILEKILKEKDTTTWQIAQCFDWEDKFNFKDKKEEERFLVKKTGIICKRLKRMSQENLVKIYKGEGNRGNKNIYEINSRRVILSKHRFPNSYGKALFLKEKDSKWQIFQI